MFRHLARAACVLVITAGPALAGDVSGKLDLPAPPPPPEPVLKGFLDRAENASLPPRSFDPTPYLVVVLVPAAAAEGTPAAANWDLVGDSFSRPVLPVHAGAEVTIRNKSKRAATLTAEADPKLIPAGPINPGGTRPFTPKAAGLIVVTDEDLPHLIGRLVVVDSPYFALPDRDGKFAIKDVPPGEYKVKVWYLDAWLDRADDNLTVPAKAKGDIPLSPKIAAYKAKAK